MPYDSTFLVTERDPATAAVRRLGINPIPPEVLQKHMDEQVRAHPPSFIYVHREAVTNLLLATPFTLAVLTFAGCLSNWEVNTFQAVLETIGASFMVGVVAMFSIVTLVEKLRFRGPAYWSVRDATGFDGIPDEMLRMGEALKRELPGSTLNVGVLIQNKTQLDPYLVLDHIGGHTILGIWDGDKIIAQA